MAADDKAENKAQELGGKAKEAFGHATGDDEKVAEGKSDQTQAGIKKVGEDVKDLLH